MESTDDTSDFSTWPTFYICKLDFTDGTPVINGQESDKYEQFSEEIYTLTNGYVCKNAKIWRSALKRFVIEYASISNNTKLHHLHICFELTSNKKNNFYKF